MSSEEIIRNMKAQCRKPQDAESFLAMLYECYDDLNGLDDGNIKTDFDNLYRAMNGKSLREMDEILYPVCTLCRSHQRAGFIEGHQSRHPAGNRRRFNYITNQGRFLREPAFCISLDSENRSC